MAYGEDTGGAVGYLVGEPNQGMRYMFTMMNDARLGVGIQGLSIAERAYQQALAFAKERVQGSPPGRPKGESAPIIEHPDVRRMLLTMRCQIEAMRAVTYANAWWIDRAAALGDTDEGRDAQEWADLLVPISKAWCTDLGAELTSLNVQIHGGMGYIEETGAAQHFRDARIAPIYEGTNGIQAIDLVGRKLPYRGGEFVAEVLAEIGGLTAELEGAGLGEVAKRYSEAHGALASATRWIFDNREDFASVLGGATPYLRLFGTVLGGYYLGRGALAAGALLEGDGDGFDRAFLEAKVASARFYAGNILPQASGLAAAATAGAADLFAIDPATL
jgi:hypothetical protein